ncbi:mlp lipofamily protein (plasmid) [Borreliella afzelii PKo]|uniref:Mlp lipofamily protein n=1 Tax=Borreliella afzelii (strain PKo) TaxID=390236 RepID=G0IT62_BORAP|nr:mlp lipofamily protein [Borreliella afzelii PKo]
MKIVNILFCLFLIMLNSCNSNDNNTLKNNTKHSQSRKRRDLEQKESQEEKPKSKEELLREKLSEDEKKQLDWLKTALENEKFDKFLENDDSKIKSALDHIKSELASCTGDNVDQKKNTFKTMVKEFFKNGDINNFNKNNVTSNCNNN